MANSVSAKKRIRQNATRRARNRWRKGRYRDVIKDYRELVLHGSVEDAQAKLSEVYKTLDQVAATPALHKNTAARLKSRLTTLLNQRRNQSQAA